ncbi:MAG TPA: urease accessory protein UreD [Nitrosopumilaceae archaeon]|nr:urease accessory protein UreD [Nitrosopumilaceae archaeon]
MNSQIPDIFKNYVNKKLKMPGQNGTIEIEIQVNEDSKTYIKSLLSKAPFLIQKAMYPDTDYPNFAHIYIMSSSGGILQGDEQKIDVVMGMNSSARITTQSATKIYKMDGGYASQYINIHNQEGSYLEFIPHQIIPFKSSRFYQEVNLEVADNAILIYSEIISAGRIASGEKFDFDLCFLRTSAYRNGKMLFTDVMSLNKKDKSNLESVFGGKTIFSTVYIIGNSIQIESIVDKINLATKSDSLLASSSSLPYDSGIIVRMLADSVSEIISLTESISGILRSVAKKNYKIEPTISNSSIDIA